MVGRVAGGECDVEEEGPVGIGGHQLPQPLAGLIHDVFRQVIALPPGRLDPLVARDQFRVPLVRLARHKAVEAVETPLQGPVVVGAGGTGLVDGPQVPLARSKRLVSVRTQHLRQVGRLAGSESPGVGKAIDHLRHPAHADAVMVAAGEQAGPGRRAERGYVEVRVAQPVGRQTVEGRRFDIGAVATEVRVAHVVEDDYYDVRFLA